MREWIELYPENNGITFRQRFIRVGDQGPEIVTRRMGYWGTEKVVLRLSGGVEVLVSEVLKDLKYARDQGVFKLHVKVCAENPERIPLYENITDVVRLRRGEAKVYNISADNRTRWREVGSQKFPVIVALHPLVIEEKGFEWLVGDLDE